MDLIGEIVLAFFQALAAILYPTQSRALIRAQRATAIILVLGVGTVVGAFLLAWFDTQFWTWFIVFLVGIVLVFIAGAIGHQIEKRIKNARREDGK